MMGSLELGPESDVSQLEPLLTSENIEQLEAAFVAQVQVTSACLLYSRMPCQYPDTSCCSLCFPAR